MNRLSVFSKDRQIDPGKVVMVSRTPDHVLHMKDATVFQERQAIRHSGYSSNTRDSGVVEIARLHPHEWRCIGKHLWPNLTTHRCLNRKNVVTKKTYKADKDESCEETFDPPGNRTRFFSRYPGRMRPRQFDADVGS